MSLTRDNATFEQWWAECCRLDPGNLADHELLPPPAGFETTWRAVYGGGFTPEEATGEARIIAYLETLDEPRPPRLHVVRAK